MALPFAREACRCMGARIWVETPRPKPSMAGEGACRFVLAVPCAVPTEALEAVGGERKALA